MRLINSVQRFYWFYKNKGFTNFFFHLLGKFFRPSRFEKFCSTVDIRNSNTKIASSPADFISFLYPELQISDIEKSILEAESVLIDNKNIFSIDFPSKWNSGRNLQIVIFAITRLISPELVVETGTANGTSANSWASGLKLNKKGKLISVDIKRSTLEGVEKENLPYIECVVSDGTIKGLSKILEANNIRNLRNSIFLHDSDHSYYGQYSDYKSAKDNDFSLLLSDDIDASLAFIDFVVNLKSIVLYDERKFIGGVRLR